MMNAVGIDVSKRKSTVTIRRPGANSFFDSPAREDGHQKWVDFVYTYWHVDRVRSMSLNAFSNNYHNWCKRFGYYFNQDKAKESLYIL